VLLLLRALLQSEGQAGLHVSFTGGLVSCRVWQGPRLVVQVVCQVLWVLQLSLGLLSGLLLSSRTKLRSEDRVGLPVSIPEGMVSYSLMAWGVGSWVVGRDGGLWLPWM